MKLLQDMEETVEDSEPERAKLRIGHQNLGQSRYHKRANLPKERTPETCQSTGEIVESHTITRAFVEITGQ